MTTIISWNEKKGVTVERNPSTLIEGLFGKNYDVLHPLIGDVYYFLDKSGSRIIVGIE